MKRWGRQAIAMLLALAASGPGLAQEGVRTKAQAEGEKQARAAIEQSIQALGGKAFLEVRDIKSNGRYYRFRKGANSVGVVYQDYTRLPNKSRYEEGTKKKDKEVTVYNLDLNKGWLLEGRKGVREAKPEEVDQFRRTVKHAVENVLRTRFNEPGVKLFYYGPNEVSGKVRSEAVELLDTENDAVIVYFDARTRLPIKLEYTEVSTDGRKQKVEEEYTNWHNIQGVQTPLRVDILVDGELANQRFVEKLSYNNSLPDTLFDKPQPEK